MDTDVIQAISRRALELSLADDRSGAALTVSHWLEAKREIEGDHETVRPHFATAA
jgi:hypothetical protein